MAKHRQPTGKKWGPYLTTGIALEAATLFAFAYATDSHVAVNPLLSATTSIFVDGTKSVTGNEEGTPFKRMADSFAGAYDQTINNRGGTNVYVEYPRSLGPLTGLGDPTYDASEAEAAAKTVAAVKAAQDPKNGYEPGDKVYVVGYSQGAGAASQAITRLERENYDTKDIEFVLASDPRRNDGGILARLPKGVYVPILGVSFGDGTTPQNTHVLQVTKQYDGVADAPDFIFNVVADLNAVMGFYYLHSGYYKDIDLDAIPAEDKIVTYGSAMDAQGNPWVTDVLIKAPVGELPLTMPLLQLGVPKEIVKALDPFLRAIIETGYSRPSVAPAQPVPFQLVPPPSNWLPDLQSVAAGAVKTGQAITGTTPSPPNPLSGNANSRITTLAVDDKPTPDIVDDKPTPDIVDDKPTPDIVDDKPTDLNDQKTPDLPPAVTTPPKPNKFEPPHRPFGGWKPGDLLRSIFNPKPKPSDGSSSVKPTSTPDAPPPSSPPADDPTDANDSRDSQDSEPAPAAA